MQVAIVPTFGHFSASVGLVSRLPLSTRQISRPRSRGEASTGFDPEVEGLLDSQSELSISFSGWECAYHVHCIAGFLCGL